MPPSVDAFHFFSDTWQTLDLLVKWAPSWAWVDQVTVFFFSQKNKIEGRISSGFRSLQVTAVTGKSLWRIMSWHIILDMNGHWPLSSYFSQEGCSRLPFDTRVTEDPIKATDRSQLITLKIHTIHSSWKWRRTTMGYTGLSCWEGAQVVTGFWSLTQFFSGSPQFENKCHKHREDRGMNHWLSSHSKICQHRKRQTHLPLFPTHWDLLRQCLEKCWLLKFARASVILETISRLFPTGRGRQLKLI